MEKELWLTPETVTEYLATHRFTELRKAACAMPTIDLAELLSELPAGELSQLYRLLPKETAAEAFSELDSDGQKVLISVFSDAELQSVLEEMYYDDVVDLIEEMPAFVVRRILRNAKPEDRRVINRLLKYPSDSAGGMMTTEYVRFRLADTVADAFAHLRACAIDSETVYTCYVTDVKNHLRGIVDVRTLFLHPETAVIGDIMNPHPLSVLTTTPREEAARTMNKYDLIALPVTDSEERLVGMITIDDAVDALQEEVEEDISVMAGVTPDETPYLRSSVLSVCRRRFPWLLLMMLGATFTSLIISGFESALAKVVVLTAFIPMLMDTGGNSGSQASVTVIRALSLGELTLSDWWRVMLKELRVALICGVSLAVVCFGKVMLFDRLLLGNPSVTLEVALVISMTLCLTILMAKMIGGLLPLLAARIGLDPAVMASPFITTIVDSLTLLVYFGIAHSLLPL